MRCPRHAGSGAGPPEVVAATQWCPDGGGSKVGDDVGDVELCVDVGDTRDVDAPWNRVVIGQLAAEDHIGEACELGVVGPQTCPRAAGPCGTREAPTPHGPPPMLRDGARPGRKQLIGHGAAILVGDGEHLCASMMTDVALSEQKTLAVP